METSFYESWHPQDSSVIYDAITIGESPFIGNLFDPKENYIQSCTERGKFRSLMSLSAKNRAKEEYNNLHLLNGMSITQRFGFPILSPCIHCPKLDCVPYSSRNEKGRENSGVHFFEDDYKFADSIWQNLDIRTYPLRNRPFVFSPDYSLYVGPLTALNIASVYKSRFVGAYWSLCGFTVIPVASWGDVDSFAYCLDGLPLNSIIAVCGIGIASRPGSIELWHIGLRELEKRLHPLEIIIYGDERDIPYLNTPITFIPPYSKTKFIKTH